MLKKEALYQRTDVASECTAASRDRLPYGESGLRQLADATGMYLVVVFFHIVRVLIHISRIVRFNGLIREMACGSTFRALELALEG
ncbi:hypothetical protein ABIB27_001754 [Arthrobacter sp. UYEF21]